MNYAGGGVEGAKFRQLIERTVHPARAEWRVSGAGRARDDTGHPIVVTGNGTEILTSPSLVDLLTG